MKAAVALLMLCSSAASGDATQRGSTWHDWAVNCQGCHRPDGAGTPGGAPPIPGMAGKFLTTPGGREYLVRVPGVAGAPLTDAEIAQVMNWVLKRFDAENLPGNFRPYTAAEITRLRKAPLGTRAGDERNRLLAQIEKNTRGNDKGGPQ